MTFSIVARSDDGESWGVAVASKFFSVGSVVPAARAGVGAVATQAWANVAYKDAALAHLDTGGNAAVVLERLLGEDNGREHRQVGIVDLDGRAATHTGSECLDWAGGVTGAGYAIQGNILTGEEVMTAMQAAFEASEPSTPLAERLLAALAAGDNAGGDARGRQSAALLVVRDGAGFDGGDDLEMDLRVDDHPHPIDELARLLGVQRRLFHTNVPEAERTPDTPELIAEMDARARALGLRSFALWIGLNNYEHLGGEDWTATQLVEELRAATPDWQPDA
ncbi:DUF1028 domain-containing protein [Nocardioides pinisoli]|uniref:DUF1028 domain-containing protein n=1 Tax=Nocardioides pinisoli TaxID=2950279 RepID=A0ABT1KX97_9ACTN|nr:DUF1028 domain-containing protein [Nocardioides pinisoli]MCP3422383.1 DUF1028 domain-containing protein [Nocardioides pinisoli]